MMRKRRLTKRMKKLLIKTIRVDPGFGEALISAAKGEPVPYYEEVNVRSRAPNPNNEQRRLEAELSRQRARENILAGVAKGRVTQRNQPKSVARKGPVKSLTIRPSDEQYDTILTIAKKHGISIRLAIRDALHDYLESEGVNIRRYNREGREPKYQLTTPNRIRLPLDTSDSITIHNYCIRAGITPQELLFTSVRRYAKKMVQ